MKFRGRVARGWLTASATDGRHQASATLADHRTAMNAAAAAATQQQRRLGAISRAMHGSSSSDSPSTERCGAAALTTTTLLKVWGRTSSVNVQKVLWTLDQLAIPYERFDTVMGGPAQDADYLTRNPNGKIPVIVDTDGTTVYESNVITRYLCAKYGAASAAPFWPASPADRAKADMLMDLQQTQFSTDSVTVFWQIVRTPEAERDADALRGGGATERGVGKD